MKSPRRFRVPVGWDSSGVQPPEEQLLSTTEVLPVPRDLPKTYQVYRIPGSWSPHIPEKRPLFRISWARNPLHEEALGHEVEYTQLGKLKSFSTFLVLRPIQRPQRCLVQAGLRHAITEATLYIRTFCGESTYTTGEKTLVAGTPDCQDCINQGDANGEGWVFYYAYPYQDKRLIKKEQHKAKTVAKRRAKLPTVFDRILLEDPLSPPPKPPKQRLELPPPDAEDELESAHREAKLRARQEAAETFKQAKKLSRHD